MKLRNGLAVLGIFALALIVGCSDSASDTASTPAASVDVSPYVLKSEPAGALDVHAVRDGDLDGKEVTLVGKVGGSRDPWVEGRAQFTLVDLTRKSCDTIEGDTCPTPWDYCCDHLDIVKSQAFVEIQDASGKPLVADARKAFGLKELDVVVVHGKVQKDAAGNITILADGIHVR